MPCACAAGTTTGRLAAAIAAALEAGENPRNPAPDIALTGHLRAPSFIYKRATFARIYIHDALARRMFSRQTAVFVLLDAVLVASLFSMLFCLRPMRFDFISEWIRQCQAHEDSYVLPIVLAVTMALIVLLQLDWMYRVSLHHLQLVSKPDAGHCVKAVELRGLDETRTRIVVQMLTFKERPAVVSVYGHSDAAFVASFSAIFGIAATVIWDWRSPQRWLHYYGVLLFCSGFFAMLQIVWLNLHTASTVASLRHMPRVRGMHWVIDSGIILFLLVFLMLNFIMGQIGPLVVGSELLGFALLLFQFLYVFQACCRTNEPPAAKRLAAWGTRVLVCVALLLPFAYQLIKRRRSI
jgi:hypothetical protein